MTLELGLVLEENLIIAPHVDVNEASAAPDNGSKHIKRRGYVLVH